MLTRVLCILFCILPLVSISMQEDVTVAFLDEKLKELPVIVGSSAEENQKILEKSNPVLKRIELKINEITKENLYDSDKHVFDAEKCILLIKMSEYINAAFKFEPKVYGKYLNTGFYVPYLRSKKVAPINSNEGTGHSFLVPVESIKIIEKCIEIRSLKNQNTVTFPPNIHPNIYLTDLSSKALKALLLSIFTNQLLQKEPSLIIPESQEVKTEDSNKPARDEKPSSNAMQTISSSQLDQWIKDIEDAHHPTKIANTFFEDNKQELIKYTLSLIAASNTSLKENGNLLMKLSKLITAFKNYYNGDDVKDKTDASYLNGKHPCVELFMKNIDPEAEYNYAKDFVLIQSNGAYFLVPKLFIDEVNKSKAKMWLEKNSASLAWTTVYCMHATLPAIKSVLKEWYEKESVDLYSSFNKFAKSERFSYWNPVSWLEYFFPNASFKNPDKLHQ